MTTCLIISGQTGIKIATNLLASHMCSQMHVHIHTCPRGHAPLQTSLCFFTISSHMPPPSESNRTPGSSTTIQTTERMSRWSYKIRAREREKWQKDKGGIRTQEDEGIFNWHSYKQSPYKLIIRTEFFKTV